mmetsp:Transcript_31611/g.35932  ORF Transcript_31611/g.35932 Transcript_31611/m.35932 type:complete len:179 (+) Transcript_31611:44-580(+)
MEAPLPEYVEVTCHDHVLGPFKQSTWKVCSLSWDNAKQKCYGTERSETRSFHRCYDCGFYLCKPCISHYRRIVQVEKVVVPFHEHSLTRIPAARSAWNRTCDNDSSPHGCQAENRDLTLLQGEGRFKCLKCGYSLCPTCTEFYGKKILEPLSDLDYEATKNSSIIIPEETDRLTWFGS